MQEDLNQRSGGGQGAQTRVLVVIMAMITRDLLLGFVGSMGRDVRVRRRHR